MECELGGRYHSHVYLGGLRRPGAYPDAMQLSWFDETKKERLLGTSKLTNTEKHFGYGTCTNN